MSKLVPLSKEEIINRTTIRKQTRDLIKKGIIVRVPCQRCGGDKNLQCHHRNYKNPKNILWLCQKCHVVCHNNYKFIKEFPKDAKKYKIKHERINNKRVCLERR
jgi:hypothetical protein